MQISQLTEFFDVEYYKLCHQSATLELIAGDIVVHSQYVFRNTEGQQKETVNVQMIVTPQQSDDLKAILATVLQTTNAEIEMATGWAKWTGDIFGVKEKK